jgi:L-threonylcarbamoyladenylate synthase
MPGSAPSQGPRPLGDLEAALEATADALEASGVVAIPTDTVYGLAALASSPSGCARLFALKGRPPKVALPVLVGDLGSAVALCAPGGRARLSLVARSCWPGPLTLVVEAATPCGHLGGDGATIGLRLPDEPVVRALCSRVGPLAVTSANRHGAPPCTSAKEVASTFGDALDGLLDAGVRDGTPSSVVSLVGDIPVILRQGPIGLADIEAALAPIQEEQGQN